MKLLYRMRMIIAIALLVSFTACKKSFLDRNPLDQISSGTFWQTEDDVKMALAGCYRQLQSDFLSYRRVWLDCLSDNAFAEWGYFNMPAMTIGVTSPTSGGAVNMAYYTPYRGIANCNYFLENVDKVPIEADKIAVYKGEVRFLRAMMYFDLVDFFGDVILYRETPESADAAKIAKSSKAEVLAFIHEDIDAAIGSLPEVAYAGHAVKGSATAFKSRVLLYEQKWPEAASYALQTIQSGKFSIADNYLGIFLTATQGGNPEIIFSTQYLGPTNPTAFTESMDVQIGWYGCINPYQDLVDEFECTDGLSISESPLYNPTTPFANRDPRLVLNMRRVAEEAWPEPQHPGQTGYVMRKYADFSHAPFSYAKTDSDQDMVSIRYADVLLMYAEAKNEDTGPDAGIYDALDEIRSRPGVNMPPVDRAKYNTKEKLREFIRHERRVELALEGHRYFDIKRWGIAHTKLPTIVNPGGVHLVFEQKHYKFPFPQAELDNNPELKQNDGY
ncbi:MAG: RagB/SusD family nutrient uptake outer membrane protein [Chitinophagaceae bacterium]|nr:RagB/SusD family nutrient uptake outer membrane protein [Chitinophagaceae bacterium]